MTVITGARGKKTFISVNFYVILSISVILLGLYQLWSNISRGTSPVIVVPGGGLTSEGKVPVWTQLRLDEAVKLYKANAKRRPIIITLSAGTPHKPNPLDSKGFAIWEAAAAAKRLIEMGIPPESVYEENISLDTIGNAYFLRSVHIDPANLKELHVITNDWHMDRTRAIFERVFSLCPSYSWVCFSTSLLPHFIYKSYNMHFVSVKAGIEDFNILKDRAAREKQSLEAFLTKTSKLWRNFEDLHRWIFTSHSAYSSKRFLNPTESQLSPDVLKTY